MRFRGKLNEENEQIKLNMTAMIDIVFQLLVFFIMTFKVVAMEGDFTVKMPLATDKPEQQEIENVTTLITVRLISDGQGKLTSIDVDNGIDGDSFTDEQMFQRLTAFVEKTMTAEDDPSSAEDTEVEFDIDFDLQYRFTVLAIEAVSGKIQADGTVKTLVEKIKFRDNSQ